MEAVYYSAHSTTYSLFFNTICSLLVLVAVNVPLRKIDVNLALNREELITILVMLNQSSALVGHSMLQILPSTMAAPFGLSTPENEWIQLFSQHIPTWLLISDAHALEDYIKGGKSESSLYIACLLYTSDAADE